MQNEFWKSKCFYTFKKLSYKLRIYDYFEGEWYTEDVVFKGFESPKENFIFWGLLLIGFLSMFAIILRNYWDNFQIFILWVVHNMFFLIVVKNT